MSRKILLDAFYNNFSDFLDQLIKVFPEDSDFPTYKMGLFLFQKTNPAVVPTTLNLHVSPYEEIIRAKNEDFILKHEFSDHIGDDDALDQIIRKLKDQWVAMSPNNKACVWQYTTILMELSKRIVNLS